MQPTWAELQDRITREDELSITTSINPGRKLSPIWINSLNARCTIIVKTDGEGNSGFPYFKIIPLSSYSVLSTIYTLSALYL